ncbi:MAG: serine hydroxymethyltransferase [Anaerolineae bacterium]|nr:serine hydroxymethyltransferase [Anaerolineae bacterium]
MSDFLFRGSLGEIDAEVHQLSQLENERQFRKLILIPSESAAPLAIREALGSSFQNLYAEGYPDEDTRWMSEDEILDYPERLAYYRRYSDPRYYKGVEYADIAESLARRRCAEVYQNERVSADDLYVNVQALSGAPANNAVYNALINPGDPILGMNLLHGGHLTHGSSVNRSGKLYAVTHYNVDPETEKIDYEVVQRIAAETKPKIIIAGYSSYPWVPDWRRFREIADSVGAILLADISHISGLVAGEAISSPVGIAHVVTFTTHKTLCGPRGACILTHDAALGRKIDRAVFPGEQGGPHVHVFAALATTFKLAKTEQFKKLQKQIITNCAALTKQLTVRGLRIPFGGSDTHLGNVDCKTVVGMDGSTLSGDIAARILDIAGIVLNRNTIPGDKTALFASGIRFGTPWMTQRGLVEKDMVVVANAIADILLSTTPYSVETRQGTTIRAKVDFEVLNQTKIKIRDLAEKAGKDLKLDYHGYPHFYYQDDKQDPKKDTTSYALSGKNIRHFVNYVFTNDAEALKPSEAQKTSIITPKGQVDGVLTCVTKNNFTLTVPSSEASLVATWLRDLSDGYVGFDSQPVRRIPGPVIVAETDNIKPNVTGDVMGKEKPYAIGFKPVSGKSLPDFHWEEKESNDLKRTSLFEIHKKMGAKMVPFAGWEMPVWYTSVVEEHMATRQAAGLFDVSHMGVYQAEGADAAVFLDSVCGNDIAGLAIGESCYTHLLDPDANVIDDCLVYRRSDEKYLLVVNASNDDKDRTWLNAVRTGAVQVDRENKGSLAFGRNVTLRNLRDPKEGADMRVDIALQGPKSREILLSLGVDTDTRKRIMKLKRTELCEAIVGGFDLVVSRTGYTGERMAFELFIHPR